MFIPTIDGHGAIHHQAIRYIRNKPDGNGATATLASGEIYDIEFSEEIVGSICEGVISANGDFTHLTYTPRTEDIARQPIIGWQVSGIYAPEPITPVGMITASDENPDGLVFGVLYPDARVLATQYGQTFENMSDFRAFCHERRVEWLRRVGPAILKMQT